MGRIAFSNPASTLHVHLSRASEEGAPVDRASNQSKSRRSTEVGLPNDCSREYRQARHLSGSWQAVDTR